MSDIIDVKSQEEFNQELNCEKPVLVDFWATWCYPCMRQGPVLHDFNDKMNGKIKVLKVNVDDNPKIAASFGIMSIPSLLLFKANEQVEKRVGLSDIDELTKMVEKYI